MAPATPTRRSFLGALASVLTGVLLLPRAGFAGVRTSHPDPRPDVDASRILAADQVPPHVAAVFDRVRQIPHIVDGIRCHCGCADVPGFYSLLSCYEDSGMAQHCLICQGEGNLAFRLHEQGKSLDEIREAVDERYG